jgi:hypothetical protein
VPAHISTPGSSRFAPRAVGITTPNVKNRTLRSRENASSVQTDLTLAETLVDETSVKVAAPSTKLRGILKYQLVLQFQAESVQEFDELVFLGGQGTAYLCSNFWVIHGDVKPLLATAY